mgnify:CR=1 FL=1
MNESIENHLSERTRLDVVNVEEEAPLAHVGISFRFVMLHVSYTSRGSTVFVGWPSASG